MFDRSLLVTVVLQLPVELMDKKILLADFWPSGCMVISQPPFFVVSAL
jgi:hypothetical protein